MNKKLFVFLCIAMIAVNVYSLVHESASLKDFIYLETDQCAYDNWLSHVVEGKNPYMHNTFAPWDRQSNNFGSFLLPDENDLTQWNLITEALLDNDLNRVEEIIELLEYPYEVVRFHDTDTQRDYIILRERINFDYYDDNGTQYTGDDECGSFDFGWGIFIFNPDSRSPVIVNVVHPEDDFIAVPIAVECFQEWNAQFLLINGCCRETLMTEGGVQNCISLCDPSRNEYTTFQTVYENCCDYIRERYNHKEHSVQIHSYDWDKHHNHACCQLSTINIYATLPIWDYSSKQISLLQKTPNIVIPSNTIGNHNEVTHNDYYAFNWDEELSFIYGNDFQYSGNQTIINVNNSVDLPGINGNSQYCYTYFTSSNSLYQNNSIVTPFFHVEFDELPECYFQTYDDYCQFYNYDQELGIFPQEKKYEKPLAFYSSYINTMKNILPLTLSPDDHDVVKKHSIISTEVSDNYIYTIEWDEIDCFDFYSTELLISSKPFSQNEITIYNKDNIADLGHPNVNSISRYLTEETDELYAAIRVVDLQGNVSELDEEKVLTFPPVKFSNYGYFYFDGSVDLCWILSSDNGAKGFNIYTRMDNCDDDVLIDTYLLNPLLTGGKPRDYIYHFNEALRDEDYSYIIKVVDNIDREFFLDESNPYDIDTYKIVVQDLTHNLSDSVNYFNSYSTLPYFNDYLENEKQTPEDEKIYLSFYKNDQYLQNIFYDGVNFADEYVSIPLKAKFNGECLFQLIGTPSNCPEIYIRNPRKKILVNIINDPIINFSDDEINDYELILGHIEPEIQFNDLEQTIYVPGDTMCISWEAVFPEVIDYYALIIETSPSNYVIADSINNLQNSFQWIIPEDLEIHRRRLEIRGYIDNEMVVNEDSSQFIYIIPERPCIFAEQGWNNITNPWMEPISLSQFGEGALLYELNDTLGYESVDIIESQKPYWLYVDDSISVYSDSDSFNGIYMQTLKNGWNMISNPFVIPFTKRNLKFSHYGQNMEFFQAMNVHLITSGAYQYNSNCYESIYSINPGSSFYLFVSLDGEDDFAYIIFDQDHYNNNTHNLLWSLPIKVSQENADSDKIIIGSYDDSTDDFDWNCDVPEPPIKPMENSIEFYILHEEWQDEIDGEYRFNEDYRDLLDCVSFDIKEWQFEIAIPSAETVIFSSEFIPQPEVYNFNISIDSVSTIITQGDFWQFNPSNDSLITGIITVDNNINNRFDDQISDADLDVFPNPFNPETSINFNLKNDCFVSLDIFNIKGQKITRLINEKLAKGAHKCFWNGVDQYGKQVGSGIYYLKLSSNNQVFTSKLILLK